MQDEVAKIPLLDWGNESVQMSFFIIVGPCPLNLYNPNPRS